MSKKKKRTDERQLSLFDVLSQVSERQNDYPEEGELDVSRKLRLALKRAIEQSGLSRPQIAGEMSHLLGCEVTKTTIDTWTAESKTGHRIPAEYVPAFCRVTQDSEPFRLLAETCGVFAMPGPEALRAEIQKFDEQERKARAEKRKRIKYLEDMEK